MLEMELDDLVIKIFEKHFALDLDCEELRQLLLSYDGNEQERVLLAVLKLSEEDPEKLRHNIQAAKIDYRDVLAWAEYPEQMDSGAMMYNTDRNDYQAIRERDRKQYTDWLSDQTDS
jgi:hypothetical protein